MSLRLTEIDDWPDDLTALRLVAEADDRFIITADGSDVGSLWRSSAGDWTLEVRADDGEIVNEAVLFVAAPDHGPVTHPVAAWAALTVLATFKEVGWL